MNPLVIRLKDAPAYLGMDKNRFKREVRPHLKVYRLPGAKTRAKGIDRLDLDAWWAEHKARSERSGKEEVCSNSRTVLSGEKNLVGDITPTSTSRKCTEGTTFVDLAKQLIQQKQNDG